MNPFEPIYEQLAALAKGQADILNKLSDKTEAEETKDFLTIDETLKKLNIGRTTLWRATMAGTIKGTRFGRRMLYACADIDAALKAVNTKVGK